MSDFEEMAGEVSDRFAADDAAEAPPDASPQASSPAESPAEEVALDYSDTQAVADYLRENPDKAVEVLQTQRRHIDGSHGEAYRKLQQAELEAAELRGRLTQPDNTASTDEPDEHGLTASQYEELGKIFDKVPSRQQEKQAAVNTEWQVRQTQVAQTFQAVKQQYGAAFTDARQRRALRIIKKAGWNLSDPDVVEECQELAQEMNAEVSSNKSGKIEQEQQTRSNAKRRVGASTERPRASSRRTGEIDIEDADGNITPASMAKAAAEYGKTL